MVVRKAIHHLRGRPREERAAAAGWFAIGVVVILFLGWAILFFNRIQNMSARSGTQSAPSQTRATGGAVQWSQQPSGE